MADEQMPSTVATEQNMSTNALGYGAGLMPNDPDAKARLAEMQKVRTGDIFQTGIQGAALGMQAAQGQTNPLAAVVQAYAAGMNAPAQMYQAKQKQIESAVGAMPFGAMVPEAMNPDSPYNVLAGIPYELASKAIAGIALEVEKAKQGRVSQKEQASITTDEEAKNYANMLGAVGIKISPESLKSLRKEDVKEFMSAKGIGDMDSDIKALAPIKKDFDNTDAIQGYNSLRTDAGTIAKIAQMSATGQAVSDQDKVLLARSFLNAQTARGGGRASEEQFAIIENQGWMGQIRDLVAGKKINLDPSQIAAIASATQIKFNEIKSNASKEAENIKPLLRGISPTGKKYILGDFAEEMKPDPQATAANAMDAMPIGSKFNGLIKTKDGWTIEVL